MTVFDISFVIPKLHQTRHFRLHYFYEGREPFPHWYMRLKQHYMNKRISEMSPFHRHPGHQTLSCVTFDYGVKSKALFMVRMDGIERCNISKCPWHSLHYTSSYCWEFQQCNLNYFRKIVNKTMNTLCNKFQKRLNIF